ncbi:hypothetical protein POPTR_008G128301v4 [Populus trichocarpa]|uniref:Uncharacterized protein n=1 Tax=Populus trichocarpa TaxID=3694 RepID=A0ACC0SLF7_POPTR|nr:hypothetical protein POPTR_008G128301v4 [Populus trichocarpa]
MRMINSSGESLLGRLFNIVLPMILQFQSGCGNKLWGAWNDAVEEACEAGVGVIAEPGGRSIRDKDAIDCCNKHGVSLFFTNVL